MKCCEREAAQLQLLSVVQNSLSLLLRLTDSPQHSGVNPEYLRFALTTNRLPSSRQSTLLTFITSEVNIEFYSVLLLYCSCTEQTPSVCNCSIHLLNKY